MSFEPYHLFPQVERLLRGIEARDSPLVQLWGWPGSGATAVLEALLARQGRRALGLSLAALETGADDASLRATLEEAQGEGVRWLVASGEPPVERLALAERWLIPGQRLVFAGGKRWPSAIPLDVVPPQELLLDPAEVLSLCLLVTGGQPSLEAARALWEATDGWYRPLRLAFESAGALALEGAGPDALLDLPVVRLFLRQQVLDVLPREESGLLLDAPEERPETGGSGEDSWQVIDALGLWVEGPKRDRLPRLLAALLDRERRRRRPRPPRPAPSLSPASKESLGEGSLSPGRPAYVLGLLGSPLARQRDDEGERDLDCRLRRSFQVLAYLASSPGLQAGREELIEAIWPIEGERTIERNFHPTLSHLRRALEAGRKRKDLPTPLLFRGGFYRLSPEVTWQVDVLDFGRLVEEGKEQESRNELEAAVDSRQRAWKLYRGPFLQGYYEGWVAARRESFQRLYLELLRDLGDLYVRLQKPGEALDAYRTVLVEDPLVERVHLAVMRLYAQQGRRDLVRRQYDKLCGILLDELGVPPAMETTQGYHQLME